MPPSDTAPSTVAMPGFAGHLSDGQIADVVNFIRTRWGNAAAPNARPEFVAALRAQQGGNEAFARTDLHWLMIPAEAFTEEWSFSPQTHAGADVAQ